MKLMPPTIVARVTWLVAAVSLLSFVLHVFVVIILVRPLFNDMTTAVAGQVILIKAFVTQAAAPPTPQDIQKLLPPNMRIALSVDPLRDVQDVPPRLAASAMSSMRDKLPADIRLSIPAEANAELQKQLLFDFVHAGQTWRISRDVFPPVLALLGSILGWLSLVALAVSASLFVGVRLVTRPMSDMAERIAAQGQRLQPLPQPKHAAQEIRAMVKAFNQLVEEVQFAERKKMQMLAGLSHDLRTPLTRLRLRAETLYDGPDAQALGQDIAAMQKMIDQFMAYVHGDTRPSLGRPDFVVEQIKHALLAYSERFCTAQFLLDDLDITLPDVAFQRLLTNLLDNAFAHGGGPVKVMLNSRSEQGIVHAVLTVYDSGPGMNQEEFKQALQPFVRLGDANDVGHSGLGLAIVAQIVDQFGGKLQAVRHADQVFGIEFSWPMGQSDTQ